MSAISNSNGGYMEDQYQSYLEDASSVDPSLQQFFKGMDFAIESGRVSSDRVVSDKEVAVIKLIEAYRSRGHLIAKTNPIRERRHHKADLSLTYFGLSESDLQTEFDAGQDIGIGRATLQAILSHLEQIYCSSIGVEFMYCRNEKLREWICREIEATGNKPNYDHQKKRYILDKIRHAVTFENFLQTKYIGKKRFSLEGIEALIPSIDAAINQGADMGVREFVFGMAHRGRLNMLVNIFGKTYEQVFSEFEEVLPPKGVRWTGDVKYHMGRSSDIKTVNGHDVHLSLVANPSHLEAVNPVVQGMVYAKCRHLFKSDAKNIMPILIHGDAAFSGQGVNYEQANMSEIEGYGVHGTVHIIANNQVGFTANYKEGRTSIYCTDLAKVTESPVFHVNADDPEAVVHAMEMAVRIRQEFGIDVYVDVLGYRRYGHNEGDEPRFTQPLLYDAISKHENVYKIFLKNLVDQKEITESEAKKKEDEFKKELQAKLEFTKEKKTEPKFDPFTRYWKGFRASQETDFDHSIETGVTKKSLKTVADAICKEPKDIALFGKMAKLLKQRKDLFFTQKKVDWAMGELLAYGTLLCENHGVRLTGQDSQRGTFSHRHAVIKCTKTEAHYIPINHSQKTQKKLQIYNSHLSEYCVMGFEYGYSLASPMDLVIWEAQFGDFSNGAQIMIDQFLSSSEAKWQRFNGLVLLLPHGYEGQGPEHSSARIERYLQLCADENLYVTNVTTPANFFHLLRRQVVNPFRIPLVVFTPKSLLRHPEVVSSVSELENGRFQELIDDDSVSVKEVKQVVLCTGKLYYDLLAACREKKRTDIALIRLEQLYPLPHKQLAKLKSKYKTVKNWFWVQEEPENMGAWSHVLRHLKGFDLECISRRESASPAVGNSKVHAIEQDQIITAVLKGKSARI
ncbi:2-oxoglutarate dehydrogenase E1 component [Candidatus Marinamargulisbacteria bacterium SCGC AG-439-L15]|nr:2-oxoglutarate dehydrogenase E1 component [Candidatus Marinamargulisbacteria bacterium SCGC AG-439-L15]